MFQTPDIRNSILFISALFLTNCFPFGDSGGEVFFDKYSSPIKTSDIDSMDIYPINRTFYFDKSKLGLPHEGGYYNYCGFDDYGFQRGLHNFNIKIEQDTTGKIYLEVNPDYIFLNSLTQNTSLTNSQNQNEYYCKILGRNDTSTRNVLYGIKENALIPKGTYIDRKKMTCILFDSNYSISFITKTITSSNTAYPIVCKKIPINEIFYIPFTFDSWMHINCWIKCSVTDSTFLVKELAIQKPYKTSEEQWEEYNKNQD